MYEVFWNWFVAMMKVVVSLKTRIAKYMVQAVQKGNLKFHHFQIPKATQPQT